MHESYIYSFGVERLRMVSGKRSQSVETNQSTNQRLYARAIRGNGKPESLKGELSGHWSRRITDEHRLIYPTTSDQLIITARRYHYEK